MRSCRAEATIEDAEVVSTALFLGMCGLRRSLYSAITHDRFYKFNSCICSFSTQNSACLILQQPCLYLSVFVIQH